MQENVLEVYPLAGVERELRGLYLAHGLRECARENDPYIYANFVASLDGRVAVKRPRSDGLMVPKNTSNDRDWRLYQELAAQADLILSTGRYLRDWAEGHAQEILQTDNPKFADLREWRTARGLKPQPDIAIISASLDFPVPRVLTASGRKVVFITKEKPNAKRVRELEARAGQVLVAGKTRVSGALLKLRIQELGYGAVYSAAGPQVFYTLLEGGVLDRLYLTLTNRILGGEDFETIVKGEGLKPAADFKLNALYFDAAGLEGLGQLFASYDCV